MDGLYWSQKWIQALPNGRDNYYCEWRHFFWSGKRRSSGYFRPQRCWKINCFKYSWWNGQLWWRGNYYWWHRYRSVFRETINHLSTKWCRVCFPILQFSPKFNGKRKCRIGFANRCGCVGFDQCFTIGGFRGTFR